jgi:hypothetical protein
MRRSKVDFIRQQGLTTSDRVLAWLGLLLIGLTARAVERQQTESAKDVISARLVLACVTAIGWVVDRLPFGALACRTHGPAQPAHERARPYRSASASSGLTSDA